MSLESNRAEETSTEIAYLEGTNPTDVRGGRRACTDVVRLEDAEGTRKAECTEGYQPPSRFRQYEDPSTHEGCSHPPNTESHA